MPIADFYSSGLVAHIFDDYLEQIENCHQTQKLRKEVLRTGCDTLRQHSNYNQKLNLIPNATHVWMNKPRHLAICTPHKVGSQTWRYFFQVFLKCFKLKGIKIQSQKKLIIFFLSM